MVSKYWQMQGLTDNDRQSDGRTFERSTGVLGCNECCNGDRCDDRSHVNRANCPYCLGTGTPKSKSGLGGEPNSEL